MTSTLLRVEWTPGSDELTGICPCGARHRAADPVEIWEWLLNHPAHQPPTDHEN